MGEKLGFQHVLDSFEKQAAQSGCLEDWLDYFHMAVRNYFAICKGSGKRASIKGLKEKIVETAKSEFEFE